MRKPKYQNDLYVTRRERGLSQKYVAALLGQSSTRELSKYERGVKLPPLPAALKLEIIYRRPVAFLYPDIYDDFRTLVRKREGARDARLITRAERSRT